MKSLPVLDPKAAAIDVGSEKLHTSIAGDAPKIFGTFTGDLEASPGALLGDGDIAGAMCLPKNVRHGAGFMLICVHSWL